VTIRIFAGPSLPSGSTQLPPGWIRCPPAKHGDIYRAVRDRPTIIALVDGLFETVPAVWHKEILWAMAKGIHVYGSSSMGALRAAELAHFGMRGVGRVFEMYRDGVLQDDDEVALLHGPAEAGYAPLTDAMVNMRATFTHAASIGIVEPAAAAKLVKAAKALFYKERTYSAVLANAVAADVPPEQITRLAEWLPVGRIDQKRADALALIETLISHLSSELKPINVGYNFQHTAMWEAARRRASQRDASS
jgi:hypothetical protein